jgi:DNA-binding response OmpR family regulator
MNNFYLNIFGSKIFYNLLNELDLQDYIINFEENLSIKNKSNSSVIRIVFPEKLSLVQCKSLIKENIPSVFLVGNKDFFKKNNLKLLEFHLYLHLPIDIFSLKELSKILITKYNFFKKSKIIVKEYEIDSNQKIISKNNISAKLTEKELKLILIISENKSLKKKDLLKKVWNYKSDVETHALETHLHRLRKKIYNIFGDSNFIIEKNSFYYLE